MPHEWQGLPPDLIRSDPLSNENYTRAGQYHRTVDPFQNRFCLRKINRIYQFLKQNFNSPAPFSVKFPCKYFENVFFTTNFLIFTSLTHFKGFSGPLYIFTRTGHNAHPFGRVGCQGPPPLPISTNEKHPTTHIVLILEILAPVQQLSLKFNFPCYIYSFAFD